MTNQHRLERVIQRRLCSGCGACAHLGREHGVVMLDIPTVGRRPVGVESLPTAVKDELLAVCPGAGVQAAAWEKEPDADELLTGPVRQVWEGWASDPQLRWAASSGGVVTALAAWALETQGMALVVHTGMDPEAPWRNRTVISRDRAGLQANSGSRYTPSSPVEALRFIEESERPCVFIGKPCDVAAVAALRRRRPQLDRNLGLVLSFFCAGTPTSAASQQLAGQLGFTKPDEIAEVRYRGQGWPGGFQVKDAAGRSAYLSYEVSWGQLASKQRQLRCTLCPDGLGELADVTGGDAWHRKSEGGDGLSLILARTQRGQEAVREAIAAGYLEASDSSPNRVVAAQGLTRRRQLVLARSAALRTLLLPTPSFPGFRLAAASRQLSLSTQMKEYLGMLRRAITRGYRRAEVGKEEQ